MGGETPMIEIETLKTLDPDGLQRIVAGYTSKAKYLVNKTETNASISPTTPIAM
jgi:hypothetical protein